jgi:hypothetical protein
MGWTKLGFREINAVEYLQRGTWLVASKETLDAGWWLNGSGRVTATGSFELMRTTNGLCIKDADVQWVWHDDIDARSIKQWWRADGRDAWKHKFDSVGSALSSSATFLNGAIESIYWDVIMDGILNTDFGVHIHWRDVRYSNAPTWIAP